MSHSRSIVYRLVLLLSLLFFYCGRVESPYLSLEVAEQQIEKLSVEQAGESATK